MIRILHLRFDSEGSMFGNDTLPLIFEDRSEAFAFLGRYLVDTFPRGKSGYRRNDDYWWACSDEPTLEVHRFTIKGPPGMPGPGKTGVLHDEAHHSCRHHCRGGSCSGDGSIICRKVVHSYSSGQAAQHSWSHHQRKPSNTILGSGTEGRSTHLRHRIRHKGGGC
jgi:hypothetical protein